MTFFASNIDGICCFDEQKSVTKDRESSLKLTKKIDVVERHGEMKSINSMDFTRGKADTNQEIAQWWKK